MQKRALKMNQLVVRAVVMPVSSEWRETEDEDKTEKCLMPHVLIVVPPQKFPSDQEVIDLYTAVYATNNIVQPKISKGKTKVRLKPDFLYIYFI